MHPIKYSVDTYIYTDRSHIHKYKYINKILIFFLGWLCRDQDMVEARNIQGYIREGASLQTINPEIHPQRGRSSQGPDPPAFSDFQ